MLEARCTPGAGAAWRAQLALRARGVSRAGPRWQFAGMGGLLVDHFLVAALGRGAWGVVPR